MPASVLLFHYTITDISVLQVDHSTTGSPTSALLSVGNLDDRIILAGPFDQVRAILTTAQAALDQADPVDGNCREHRLPWPPAEHPEGVLT
jgi:hypothetical protein